MFVDSMTVAALSVYLRAVAGINMFETIAILPLDVSLTKPLNQVAKLRIIYAENKI